MLIDLIVYCQGYPMAENSGTEKVFDTFTIQNLICSNC